MGAIAGRFYPVCRVAAGRRDGQATAPDAAAQGTAASKCQGMVPAVAQCGDVFRQPTEDAASPLKMLGEKAIASIEAQRVTCFVLCALFICVRTYRHRQTSMMHDWRAHSIF